MNDIFSRIVKRLLVSEPFYGSFVVQLNNEYCDFIDDIDFTIEGISPKILLNKSYLESTPIDTVIDLLIHNIDHILKRHYNETEIYDCDDTINYCFDLANRFTTNIGLPAGKSPRYYYRHIKDVDYKEDNNDVSLREENPTLAEALESFWYKWKGDKESLGVLESYLNIPLKHHLIWDYIQQVYKGYKTEYNTVSISDFESFITLMTDQMTFNMIQAYKGCGKCPAYLTEEIINLLTPKKAAFNWKRAFRGIMGNTFNDEFKMTRMRESCRFEDSFGHKHQMKSKILIGIDTSGSMTSRELCEVFNEIHNVYNAGHEIYIIEGDTDIICEYKYTGKKVNTVHGRGGTSFEKFVEYWNNHYREYDGFILCTDGYDSVQDLQPIKPMTWLIVSGGYQEHVYPGKTIFIEK